MSETHASYSRAPGEPRTYVKVSEDRGSRIDRDELLENLKAGRAFAGTGPVLWLTVRAGESVATLGDLLSPATGDLVLSIEVETPTTFSGGQAPLVFSNPIYLDRDGNGRYDPPYPMR